MFWDLGDPLGLDHFRQRPTLGFIKLVFSLMRQGTRLTRGKASKNRRPRNNHTSGRLAADRRGFASGVLEIVLLRKGAANDFISSPFKCGLQTRTEGRRSLDGVGEGAAVGGGATLVVS